VLHLKTCLLSKFEYNHSCPQIGLSSVRVWMHVCIVLRNPTLVADDVLCCCKCQGSTIVNAKKCQQWDALQGAVGYVHTCVWLCCVHQSVMGVCLVGVFKTNSGCNGMCFIWGCVYWTTLEYNHSHLQMWLISMHVWM